MLVYVLNNQSKPLMPCKSSKARKLLKQKKAKVIKREPFTIQLLYGSSGYKQNINLGIDAGSKHIGVSATTNKKELFLAEIELRNNIVNLLSTRKQNRKVRRNRLRYREVRFNNRIKSKRKGWLAPSVENKINTHIKIVNEVYKILPITKIIIETASFDIQKIKNPNIQNEEYQCGEQYGFWNVREYVLFRDNYKCQQCRGKSKDPILNVHHIESRKTGGNAPNNLITLCKTCHKKYHEGKIQLKLKRGQSFKNEAFMGIMRHTFYNRLKSMYPDVSMTYGYITKNTRIKYNLPKEHYIDARCISGNPDVEGLKYYYYYKQIRRHNRQIHKAKILKGGKRKLNQAPYIVNNFRLFDKVLFEDKKCFIFGRRTSGYFDLRYLNGDRINSFVSYKKIKLLNKRNTLLIEKRDLL